MEELLKNHNVVPVGSELD